MTARVLPDSPQPFPDGAIFHSYPEMVKGYQGWYADPETNEPIAFFRDDPATMTGKIEIASDRHKELGLPTELSATPLRVVARDPSFDIGENPPPGNQTPAAASQDAPLPNDGVREPLPDSLAIEHFGEGHILTRDEANGIRAMAATLAALADHTARIEKVYMDITGDNNAAREGFRIALANAAAKIGSSPVSAFSTADLRDARTNFVESYKNASRVGDLISLAIRFARIFLR